METIGGQRQQVQSWDKWCIGINSAKKADILSSVKEQDEELFRVLVANPQKLESFFDELATSLHSEILKKQGDVNSIEFDFEDYRVRLSNLIPPGTPQSIEHYYWCIEQ